MKLLILLVSSISCAQIRYTYLPNNYDGAFESEFQVNHIDECSWRAIERNKIGFRFITRGEEMFCALLKEIRRFVKKSNDTVMDYILDTTAKDDVCRVDYARNVSEFISGRCSIKGNDCKMLQTLKNYCSFVGIDNAECISLKGHTVSVIECPPGQELVLLLKETAHFCPKGKMLKEVLRGKAICCGAQDNYESGTGMCCPDRSTQYAIRGSIEFCCKSGQNPFKASNGAIKCCESNKYLQEKSGFTHCCPSGHELTPPDRCCPSGQIFQKHENGKDFCCPKGEELKGIKNGSGRCCKPDEDNPVENSCCGYGMDDIPWVFVQNSSGSKCCRKGKTPVKAIDGYVLCCTAEYKYARKCGEDYYCMQKLDGKC